MHFNKSFKYKHLIRSLQITHNTAQSENRIPEI